MRTHLALPVSLWLSAVPALAQNPTIDLNLWTTEHINGTGPWVIDAPRLKCHATNVAITDVSVLYSDFLMPAMFEFRMWIDPAGGDDDISGFVLGWNPGDSSNPTPDYLLVDWKKVTQSFQDWGTAVQGLAVSRVNGQFTRGYGGGPRDLWSHTGVCTELARGNAYGSRGWDFATNYHFRVLLSSSTLDIWVNGALEFHLTGTFNTNGRFGGYQYSQHMTSYQFPLAGSFTAYGNGCRGSAGTPYLFSPMSPSMGTDLPIVIANLPAAAPCLVLVGASSSSWQGIPLPFDLSPAGAPGCSLLASGQLFLSAPNFNGTGFLSLPIPTSLIPGMQFYTQGMVIDLAGNALGLVFSNAASATIGVR
jgi:hypothetical protein